MESLASFSHTHPLIPAPSNSVFASLHRRTRTADSASSVVTKTLETRDAAARDAKRFLLQVVRSDWTYPPLETDPAKTAEDAAAVSEESRDIIGWRHREQENSGSDADDGHGGPEGIDPYRFDSPDAVARGVSDRRRKRRKIIEDEMKWNEGLNLWMARRDAWTGAKVPEPPSAPAVTGTKAELETYRQSLSSEESYSGSYDTDLVDTESQYTLSRPASNASASAHVKKPPTSVTVTAPPEDEIECITVSLDKKATLDPPVTTNQTTPEVDDECLIPVMGPLVPDSNLLRAAITPNVYPAIYSRLVVQSNTPAVPINLAHMTRALVQGWKTNGEWPPKPTPCRDVPVIKRPKAVNNEANELKDGKGRRLSGVSNAVKKVLGLSSFNSGNRLHIRSNSHSGSMSRPATDEGA
ncbi:uncharacterized protein GIQ15_05861 [Arthroderma uncinatum]|uniref:uncharacterized protein n=1 Tax=Arthroderma uncinatum TaxID=74035 RepID=UPI00144A9F68|nr:uncharacterized protein GIQ15_05861 [Arthroderma uncinatum]KAF3480514.1 hypothetical protein GIQ15_05861 [Arthroderma uncinatum]